MVHQQVLVTQILTHNSILLMLSLIMTSTFKHLFKHDVLSTDRKSPGISSLKHQSCGYNQPFYFFQKIKMAKLAVFNLSFYNEILNKSLCQSFPSSFIKCCLFRILEKSIGKYICLFIY